jgi:hypothetical protein
MRVLHLVDSGAVLYRLAEAQHRARAAHERAQVMAGALPALASHVAMHMRELLEKATIGLRMSCEIREPQRLPAGRLRTASRTTFFAKLTRRRLKRGTSTRSSSFRPPSTAKSPSTTTIQRLSTQIGRPNFRKLNRVDASVH